MGIPWNKKAFQWKTNRPLSQMSKFEQVYVRSHGHALSRERQTDTTSHNLKTKMHSSGMRSAHLLTVSQHALLRRVCPGGMSTKGGCLPGGDVCLGVSAQGGCLPRGFCPGRCLPGGGVSQHAMRQTPSVDRQTPVKT